VQYKWNQYITKRDVKLLELSKLYIQNDRIDEAIRSRKLENKLTMMIEKRAVDLK
jgi:hypothetical protein